MIAKRSEHFIEDIGTRDILNRYIAEIRTFKAKHSSFGQDDLIKIHKLISPVDKIKKHQKLRNAIFYQIFPSIRGNSVSRSLFRRERFHIFGLATTKRFVGKSLLWLNQ